MPHDTFKLSHSYFLKMLAKLSIIRIACLIVELHGTGDRLGESETARCRDVITQLVPHLVIKMFSSLQR